MLSQYAVPPAASAADAVPVRRAARGLRSLLLVDEPLGVFGLEIIKGVAEERLCGGDKFRIGVAEAHHRAFLGR